MIQSCQTNIGAFYRGYKYFVYEIGVFLPHPKVGER